MFSSEVQVRKQHVQQPLRTGTYWQQLQLESEAHLWSVGSEARNDPTCCHISGGQYSGVSCIWKGIISCWRVRLEPKSARTSTRFLWLFWLNSRFSAAEATDQNQPAFHQVILQADLASVVGMELCHVTVFFPFDPTAVTTVLLLLLFSCSSAQDFFSVTSIFTSTICTI